MNNFHWPAPDTDGSYWDNSHEGDPGENKVKFTSMSRRAAAILIDWVLPFVALLVIGNGLVSDVILVAMLGNGIWYQGTTGHSLGKQALGLRLAYVPEKKDETTWTFITPGVARCALRYVLHILDLICFIGLIKAIINPWGRSFADVLTSCVVINDSRITLMSKDEYRSGVRSG